jgi:hypothetical protein
MNGKTKNWLDGDARRNGSEVTGLPVAGYKPTQPGTAIEAVNVFKELEERTLRQIEVLLGERTAGAGSPPYRYHPGCDARMLAVGRTQLQLAFMALNRAVFQPGRVELPEDGSDQITGG